MRDACQRGWSSEGAGFRRSYLLIGRRGGERELTRRANKRGQYVLDRRTSGTSSPALVGRQEREPDLGRDRRRADAQRGDRQSPQIGARGPRQGVPVVLVGVLLGSARPRIAPAVSASVLRRRRDARRPREYRARNVVRDRTRCPTRPHRGRRRRADVASGHNRGTEGSDVPVAARRSHHRGVPLLRLAAPRAWGLIARITASSPTSRRRTAGASANGIAAR